MKRYFFLRILLPILIIFTVASPLPANGSVIVLKVIDGDTLKVSYGGIKESVRLIGIDTPESRMNKRAKLQSLRSSNDVKVIISQGKKAKNFVKSLVKKGDIVRIEFDIR